MSDALSLPEAENWTVLIVDDEPDNIGVPQQLMSYLGARVLTAENGAQALQRMEQETPSLVLLDLSMPVLDGWETLKAIRANPAWHQVCVIALTAHAMLGDEERVAAAGFDGYIPKPIILPDFLHQVRQIVQASQQRAVNLAPGGTDG